MTNKSWGPACLNDFLSWAATKRGKYIEPHTLKHPQYCGKRTMRYKPLAGTGNGGY